MSDIRGMGPTQWAQFRDKRWENFRARCALPGQQAHQIVAADGVVTFAVGRLRFESLDAGEDWLDEIRDSE